MSEEGMMAVSRDTLLESADGIAGWDDDKRKDFVKTFEDRTGMARAILKQTADKIQQTALRRKFISYAATTKIETCGWHGNAPSNRRGEADRIAGERAEAILRELPSLNAAVRLIDPVTARKIAKAEQYRKKGQELTNQLIEVTEEVSLSENQDMVVRDFLEMVQKRQALAKRLRLRIQEVGGKGSQLQKEIDKALYKGVPGIQEELIKVIQDHHNRVTALGEMGRRVSEQVKFGDSDEALSLLRTFEKDEVDTPVEFKDMIKAAVAKLRAKGKALATKKKPVRKAITSRKGKRK